MLPGRYEELWFTADRAGTVSSLLQPALRNRACLAWSGRSIVMTAQDYQRWLAENGASQTLAARGRVLFTQFGCAGCHMAEGRGGNGTVRAPDLDGVYGSPVPLSDRTVVVADDQYIRDSILQPERQVVAGFEPLMPSFAGVDARGGSRRADRLHQVARCARRSGRPGMSVTIDAPASELSQPGDDAFLLAVHHGPQAHRAAFRRCDHGVLLHRRRARRPWCGST